MVGEFVCANTHSICLFVLLAQTRNRFSSSSSGSTTPSFLFPHRFHKESGDSIWRDFSLCVRWSGARMREGNGGAGINR